MPSYCEKNRMKNGYFKGRIPKYYYNEIYHLTIIND